MNLSRVLGQLRKQRSDLQRAITALEALQRIYRTSSSAGNRDKKKRTARPKSVRIISSRGSGNRNRRSKLAPVLVFPVSERRA